MKNLTKTKSLKGNGTIFKEQKPSRNLSTTLEGWRFCWAKARDLILWLKDQKVSSVVLSVQLLLIWVKKNMKILSPVAPMVPKGRFGQRRIWCFRSKIRKCFLLTEPCIKAGVSHTTRFISSELPTGKILTNFFFNFNPKTYQNELSRPYLRLLPRCRVR